MQADKRAPTVWEKVAIGVAVVAALGTAYQAYVASDTEIRSLRGYAMVDNGHIEIDNNRAIKVTVNVKNYGSTPIYDFRHWACAFLRAKPSSDSDFPDITAVWAPRSIVPPQAGKGKFIEGLCDRQLGGPISEDERAQVRTGAKAIYAVGVIRYIDAFRIKRITRYRFYWNDTSGAANFDDTSGNCADEGCGSLQ